MPVEAKTRPAPQVVRAYDTLDLMNDLTLVINRSSSRVNRKRMKASGPEQLSVEVTVDAPDGPHRFMLIATEVD
jgi:hypothetical protein